MNAVRSAFRRAWDRMCDPGLRKPLLLINVCLLSVILGLLLLRGYGRAFSLSGQEDPAETHLRLENVLPALPAAPEEETEREAELPEASEALGGWREEDGKTVYVLEDGSLAAGLKRIDGKLYYFDQNGAKAASLGMDVSFYNSSIDWDAVKAQGIDFVIIRVGGRYWTGGGLYEDCRVGEFLRGARRAGLQIGVYFYSTAVDPAEAVEEAEMTLRALNGIRLELPVFLDLEYSGQYPYGRADLLGGADRAEIARAFCQTVENAGYRAGVYAGQNFWKDSVHYRALSRYPVWLASYTAENRLPNFRWRYDLWQFTDSARLFGVAGEVDLNVIF